jgi:hypothetical protein
MQHQLNVQHQSISGAFQDLNKLMQQVKIKFNFFFIKNFCLFIKAKDMVSISKTIANKIQEKRSDLTSDEVKLII